MLTCFVDYTFVIMPTGTKYKEDQNMDFTMIYLLNN